LPPAEIGTAQQEFPVSKATHNGTYAVPFKVHDHDGVNSVMVYAHDSGQRYHWSFAAEPAIRSCQEWFEDPYVPDGCVGTVNLIPLSWIGEGDEYVG
jgi:hypothetical protein